MPSAASLNMLEIFSNRLFILCFRVEWVEIIEPKNAFEINRMTCLLNTGQQSTDFFIRIQLIWPTREKDLQSCLHWVPKFVAMQFALFFPVIFSSRTHILFPGAIDVQMELLCESKFPVNCINIISDLSAFSLTN